MVNLLRSGAALTDLACPACSSPLFRLRNGDLWCAKDEKKVIVQKENEEPETETTDTLGNLENTLLMKIEDIQKKMQNETNIDELQKLGNALSGLLETLEKTRNARKR